MQPDLKDVLTGLNHNQHVNDDFVAAFLQAGIAPNRLDHPSLRGLFKKYTSVEGCLGKGATHYRTSKRVGKLHIGAIRNRVKAKKVWIGTDEYTDNSGHAIIDVLLGYGRNVYVVATVELVCKGPNNGVEHSELGPAVVKVLTQMGVDRGDVYAFSSDRASVLRKAYDDILTTGMS